MANAKKNCAGAIQDIDDALKINGQLKDPAIVRSLFMDEYNRKAKISPE